ncbi:ribbon-helix-helix protein, CopG family [Brasilonema bromeliae]|uniref:CopG family transcriptional regulator n=1 Tax=Brasilonema bromeliae SPC951 TaxID=385972 RepID=A0ABX1P880_9CYAN|nr:ribbon-helix-helix protein, CopG family [Brasilonema bromeliae]NMG19790.1 CopG family transcriptional regulator [Brasilonema bromeliae SPC951]
MKKLTIRCSDEEYKILVEYCKETDRTQNDVLRELIRKLKKSRPRRAGL